MTLAWRICNDLSEVVVLLDSADAPQDVSLPLLPFLETPKGQGEGVTHEDLWYTEIVHDFMNLYWQKPGKFEWEWIFKGMGSMWKEYKVASDQFIDMVFPGRDTWFNILTQGPWNSSNFLLIKIYN